MMSPFEDNMIRYMTRKLFSGVKYMKDKGFCHRDLKPENICLDSDFNLKIIDWGFAASYHEGELARTFLGSGAYMAIEIRKRDPYDAHKADMFSLGVIMYALKMRNYPWKEAKPNDLGYK